MGPRTMGDQLGAFLDVLGWYADDAEDARMPAVRPSSCVIAPLTPKPRRQGLARDRTLCRRKRGRDFAQAFPRFAAEDLTLGSTRRAHLFAKRMRRRRRWPHSMSLFRAGRSVSEAFREIVVLTLPL